VGLDIPLRLSLVGLSNSYAAAKSSSILSSAQSTIDASNAVALVATAFQFLAVILGSYVMRKNVSPGFKKGTWPFGLATGIVSLLFIPAFLAGSMLSGLFNLVGFALLVIWSILVGLSLRSVPKNQVNMTKMPDKSLV
jgi:hypothetical protein